VKLVNVGFTFGIPLLEPSSRSSEYSSISFSAGGGVGGATRIYSSSLEREVKEKKTFSLIAGWDFLSLVLTSVSRRLNYSWLFAQIQPILRE